MSSESSPPPPSHLKFYEILEKLTQRVEDMNAQLASTNEKVNRMEVAQGKQPSSSRVHEEPEASKGLGGTTHTTFDPSFKQAQPTPLSKPYQQRRSPIVQDILDSHEDDYYEDPLLRHPKRRIFQDRAQARAYLERDLEEEEEAERGQFHRGYNRNIRERGQAQDQQALHNLKLQVPPFYGSSDPEEYLTWVRKTERVFDVMGYNEVTKVKLAIIEFHDYAIIWWEQEHQARARNRQAPIDTWEEIKQVMRTRFVPSYYDRDCAQKLQHLTQGNRSVEDYQKDLESALMRANVKENDEAKMARFLYGLRDDISRTVELCDYRDYQDLVHKSIRVERQLKKGSSYTSYHTSNRNSWSKTPSTSKSTFSKSYPRATTSSSRVHMRLHVSPCILDTSHTNAR